MTNPSKTAKAALKKTFPNVKFTFKTYRSNIYVKWDLMLGSFVTVDAVKEVINPFSTRKSHGDTQNDTFWIEGYRFILEPVIAPEVKAAAIAYIKETSDATWVEKTQVWLEKSGARHFYAHKRFEYYCGNQLTSPLLDEYGHEPSAKRLYYTRLAESAIKTENGCIQLVQL